MPGLDRAGFGQSFLASRRIDAVHVISADNRWYQYPEIPEALEVIRRIAARYPRTVAYGMSMGGYAAIRFGAAAGAAGALAISPQFSVDPEIVPFENRWLEDARCIDFRLERTWRPGFVDTAYVVHDPYNLDRRHVELFARHTRVIPIGVRNSGHPSSGFLAEIGLLQNLVLSVAREGFDEAAFRAQVRERRKRSALFFCSLADRCKNPQRQVRLLERAAELAPGHAGIRMRYGLSLCRAGRLAEARRVCEDARERAPDDPVLLCEYSEFLIRIGHWERAEAAIVDLVSRRPSFPPYESRLATLRSLLAAERVRTGPFGGEAAPSDAPRRPNVRRFLRRMGQRFSRLRPLPELRVTTVPAPPAFARTWRRHLELIRNLPTERLQLLLVGDSLVQQWPDDCWGRIKFFNFGVEADKTQHTLWRLQQLYPGQISAKRALIMLGTNNLGADDGPKAICAGVAAVVRRLRRVVPGVRCWVVEIPPCGSQFGFRNADRIRANELLRGGKSFQTLNVDEVITTGFSADCRNYRPDHIHFTDEGYRVLTRQILSEMS